jgi:O-antigen/teichoic acid export membrane protein
MSTRPPARDARRALVARAADVLRHGATHRMLVGSVVAGLGAYAYQVVGARVLGDVAYAPISVLWTIQFLTLSIVLYSVEAYVTRLTALDAAGAVGLRRVLVVLASGVAALAVCLTAVTYVFREPLFHGLDDLAFAVGLTVISYGAFVVVRGLFAGTDRFGAYGIATALESVARLSLAVPVLLVFATPRSLAWVTPLGGMIAAGWWWMGNRVRPPTRRPRWSEAGLAPTSPFRFVGLTAIANTAAQVILAGGPLLLVALRASPSDVSIFFITSTAARAPLVLAYGGLLSRVLPFLTRLYAEGEVLRVRMVARRFAVGSLLAALVAALAGAALGPALIALFFGRSFEPAWWLAAGAAAGVVMATGAVMLNQVLVAGGAESRMVIPWVAAAIAGGIAIAVTPGDPVLRVTLGFVVAELVALCAVYAAILTSTLRVRSAEPYQVRARDEGAVG